MSMRLIPVLDVMNGVVVRGVGGRRSEYRPIVSQLTSSTDPVEVARVLIELVSPSRAVPGGSGCHSAAPPRIELYRQDSRSGRVALGRCRRAGCGRGEADPAMSDAMSSPGLETVPGPAVLAEIVDGRRAERVVFSLDLRDGVPMRDWPDTRGGGIPIQPERMDRIGIPSPQWSHAASRG